MANKGKRWMIIIGFAGFVALGGGATCCIGAVFLGERARPETSRSGPGGRAPRAASQRDTSIARHHLAERFTLGEFEYVVDDFEWRDRVGNRFVSERPSEGAAFLVVNYQEKNLGNETATGMSENMVLNDGQGRTFRPASRVMLQLRMEKRAEFLAELQPGITRRASVAFEVPEDLKDQPDKLVLEVTERGILGTNKARVAFAAIPPGNQLSENVAGSGD